MNLILENSPDVPYCTDVSAALRALGVEPEAFDWHLSDVECNKPVPELATGCQWLTGNEFSQLLKRAPIQFIWGVFSAVAPGVRPVVDVAPFADGNTDFWRIPECPPQLPSAALEIVFWDSSATLLIGISEEMAGRFVHAFPYAKPLTPANPLGSI
ncbi:hypothetical protein CLU88_2846 [Acidovorax sp. 56]|uniref:hypothetical protein n=1 Tax=Acidovorax sp. 56 TaxID=2035205 RepID=UPI000C164EAF|nr:hypothetical protein [Acidovorax sp. 56]PIF27941.1 hypothetical protein CLU88_2846 [Acidovorax sp. 56]